MASILDVNVLASAFNIDKADLMGRVYYVEDFDISIRECSFDDFIEIDTFNELKAIDKSYDV